MIVSTLNIAARAALISALALALWAPTASASGGTERRIGQILAGNAAALPGASACGVVTRDASVMLLMVTMPPERWDVRAPPPPCPSIGYEANVGRGW